MVARAGHVVRVPLAEHTAGRILVALALVAGLACAPAERQGGRALTTDSAGITIVISDSTTVAATVRAEVEPAPDLDPADRAFSEFFQIEGLIALGDGFGVIHRSTGEIRIFDAGGDYLRSVGRLGEGPGELQWLRFAAAYRGDSLLVNDAMDGRFTVFEPSGAVARTFFAEWQDGYGAFITPVLALPNGGIVVHSKPAGMIMSGAGTAIDSSVFGIHDAEGRPVADLGRGPTGARTSILRDGIVTTLPAPFAPSASGARWDEGFCLGFGVSFEIRCHDGEGALRTIARAAISPTPVSAEMIERFVEAKLAERPSSAQRAFRRVLDDIPYPTALPVYARIVAGADGALWVGEYQAFDDAPSRWWRLDRAGEITGSAVFPSRFAPHIFAGGIVRGVWRDALDVEHVRTYRLRWP